MRVSGAHTRGRGGVSDMPIEWSDRPRRDVPREGQVLRQLVRVGRRCPKARVRLLGPPQCLLTHFAETVDGEGNRVGRTYPCLGEECQLCPDQKGRRWKGYAPCQLEAYDAQTGKRVLAERVLELTEASLDRLEGEEQCRGLVLEVSRRGPRSNGPLVLRVLERQGDLAGLPPAFDVKPSLYHLWGMEPAPPAAPSPETKPSVPFRKQA